MSLKPEFHFDFGSPNTYFCHHVIPDIEQRTGVQFDYVPVLLGGIFKATNNRSPMEQFAGVKNKQEYNALETQRFIKKHGIENFKFNPGFPINTLSIMRAAVFAKEQDYFRQYIEAIYTAMWEQEMNMGDAEVIMSVLETANLPAQEIMAGTQDPAIKQQLIQNTENSVSRGSFGSPTFFVGDEIFFGKDKLRDVEEEIIAQS